MSSDSMIFRKVLSHLERLGREGYKDFPWQPDSSSESQRKLELVEHLIGLEDCEFQLPGHPTAHSADEELPRWITQYYRLFVDNPYFRLYEYLQLDQDFAAIQALSLQLHMGLFAYLDPTNQELRYLYGPGDREDDQGKQPPHFFIRSYTDVGRKDENSSSTFVSTTSDHFRRSAEWFYYSRREMPWHHLDFARILNDHLSSNTDWHPRRTIFEREHEILYVPSGEIDSCILNWILVGQKQGAKKKAFDAIQSWILGKKNSARRFSLSLQHTVPPRRSEIEKSEVLDPWENGISRTIIGWLIALGLIRHAHGELDPLSPQDCSVTERGAAMVHWLEVYLSSLFADAKVGCCETQLDSKEFATFFGILSPVPLSFSPLTRDRVIDPMAFFRGLKGGDLRDLHSLSPQQAPMSVLWSGLRPEIRRMIDGALQENQKFVEQDQLALVLDDVRRTARSAEFLSPKIWGGVQLSKLCLDLLPKAAASLRVKYWEDELVADLFSAAGYSCFSRREQSREHLSYWLDRNSSAWLSQQAFLPQIKACTWEAWVRDFLRSAASFRAAPQPKSGCVAVLHAVRLFVAWNEPKENLQVRLSGAQAPRIAALRFQSRCRISLAPHLFLRAGDRGQGKGTPPETNSRAWLAFSVLEDRVSGYSGSLNKLAAVGFFLGTFRDSPRNDSRSFFRGADDDAFTELITKTRTIVKAIAAVENREIYQHEIRRARDSRLQQKRDRQLLHELRNIMHQVVPAALLLRGILDREAGTQHSVRQAGRSLIEGVLDHFYPRFHWIDEIAAGHRQERSSSNPDLTPISVAFLKARAKDLRSWLEIEQFPEQGVIIDLDLSCIDQIPKGALIPSMTISLLFREVFRNLVKYADRQSKVLCRLFPTEEGLHFRCDNRRRLQPSRTPPSGLGLEFFDGVVKRYEPRSLVRGSGALTPGYSHVTEAFIYYTFLEEAGCVSV